MPERVDLATIDPEASVMDLGRIMAASGFFSDVRDAGQAVVKILAGRELGLPPIAAMTGIYVVKGRVTLSANIMGALIKKSGKYNYRVTAHTTEVCQILFLEREDGAWVEVGVSEFTMGDAKAAGLAGGQNWKAYPRNMLFARALSNGAKFYCPDVFAEPVYTPDELDDEVRYDAEGEVVNAPPVPVPNEALPAEAPPTTAYDREHKPGTMPKAGQKVTAAQKRKLLALASDLGIADHRKETAAQDLGHPVASFNDLTKQEAHKLIDAWQGRVDHEESSDNDGVPEAGPQTSGGSDGPEETTVEGGEDDGAHTMGKRAGGSTDDPSPESSSPSPSTKAGAGSGAKRGTGSRTASAGDDGGANTSSPADAPPDADPQAPGGERFSTTDLAYLRGIVDGNIKAPAKKRELADAWLTYRLAVEA